MDELNRQLLKDAIGRLPVHKAADYIWEEIRWGLDKPLSAELPLHPAPENAWDLLMGNNLSQSRNRHFLSFVSTFFAILLISTPLVPLVDRSNYPIPEAAGIQTENIDNHLVFAQNNSNTDGSAAAPFPASRAEVNLPVTAESPVVRQSAAAGLQRNGLPSLSAPDLLRNSLFFIAEPSAPFFRKTERKPVGCSPFQKPRASLFMLATYEPMVFDSPALSSPAHGYTLNAGFEYNRLRLSLGAGYLQLGSHSEVNYDYRTNELIYSYDYVDSVYIDPITHQTYYFTVKVDVYDSVDHTATEDVHDRFSFLKIPLTISYELAGFRNFSLLLQAGAAYHLLQNDKRSFKPFNEASSRLVSTALEAKKINDGFWSAGGGITLAYKAGRAFELQLTPRFEYSFISIEGIKTRPEPSYGLSIGLLYKINAGP